jgi:hypothetical protein
MPEKIPKEMKLVARGLLAPVELIVKLPHK